jgi:hypothetical protein
MYLFHPASNTPLGGQLKQVAARPIAQARLIVDGSETTVQTAPTDTDVTFEISLEKDRRVELAGQFLNEDGKVVCGAFYTFLQKKDSQGETPSVIDHPTGSL